MSKDAVIPNLVAETFITTFKIFMVIFVLTNIVWAVVYFRQPSSRVGDNKIEITQTGNRDISQEIKN